MNAANVITVIAVLLLVLIISLPLIKKMKSGETCCGTKKSRSGIKNSKILSAAISLV